MFIGSSSIRAWRTLESDMSPFKAVNHGFGGSGIRDAINYIDRLIVPFHPAAVVCFTGTNDINGIPGKTRTGREVYKDTAYFIQKVQRRLPGVPVFYVSITPTELRWKVWNEARTANKLIKSYCDKRKGVYYIDLAALMVNAKGMPDPKYYKKDKLHPNEAGYRVWTDVIKRALAEELM
ncbi:GDSL-type esterase/lipase family protein [Paenibacillus tarimensis]|uniref:GDSL-type esterase/lipase family protein n=1 Tax=Paenibacillus tarimensis TaxID=416012 RepID=UPI001F34B254|nr:GDSL-type esterase/lipase family protein [Paenibacillus tarimensis]MCF2946394.1 GDSL-type esterase/lipase family protein [Paenibacillus tarimensis]